MGRFKEAVKHVQRAAKALYEATKEVFERVKVTVQRLVELFVEAVTRVLAWVDEHKAYLFLMAAVAAGVVALSAALNMWGLVELDKLAYAASLTPFVAAGVKEYSREEVFNMLKAPDPYEKFKEIAKAANAGRLKLAEPWESLRVLIMPKRSEESRLIHSKTYRELDERKKKALFYAVLAMEEAFGVYRTALRNYVETVQRVKVGEEPFKQDMYVADLGRLRQLAEKEEEAFENALSTLRKRLNEYAHMYGLGDLLNVEEGKAKELAEAKQPELSEFGGVNSGVKAYAALIAYREYALGKRGAFSAAARYWLEVGGSARLLYYTPSTAYIKAKKARAGRPAEVEEMIAEVLRRLFLKPGADYHRGFVEELAKAGKLALMPEGENESSYVFKLFRLEDDGGLKELGIKLSIRKVGESIVYALKFDDVERGGGGSSCRSLRRRRRRQRRLGERLLVEDRFPYMLGWVGSDVAIHRKGNKRVLEMSTSYLWQLAETHALFDWSYVTVLGVVLTLEGPKPQFYAHTSLEKLDDVIRRSAEGGWLKMLGVEAESWDKLRRWVVGNWDVVVDAAGRRLGGDVRSELEALRNKLNDDKVAREVIAPALLPIQAERLGLNEETLRYFGAVASGAIDGDGYVSAAMKRIEPTSGEHEIALLWAAALAAHGIKAEVRDAGSAYQVVMSGGDAARLTGLYSRYSPPLLEGDDRLKNHKLAEAVGLWAEGLDIRWEGLRRRTEDGLVADLTISVGGVAVKYNVYLRGDAIELEFRSTDRSRAELAAHLLRLAGVDAEVKKEDVGDEWHVRATTDMFAAGREKLRKALAKVVRRGHGERLG